MICRQLPNAADKEAYDLLKNNVPSVESHPHTFAWFCLVSRFNETVKASWTATAAKSAEKKPAAKKEEAKPAATEAAAADEDELDLFGDGPSEVSFRSPCSTLLLNFKYI